MKEERNTKGKLLTVQRASKTYSLDPSLIYHWIRYKKFDHHKCGKKILFWESDLLEYLEINKVRKCEELEK